MVKVMLFLNRYQSVIYLDKPLGKGKGTIVKAWLEIYIRSELCKNAKSALAISATKSKLL